MSGWLRFSRIFLFLWCLWAGAFVFASGEGPTTRGDDLSAAELAGIERVVIDGPPRPPAGAVRPEVKELSRAAVLLAVPTSTWTFGCSATAAGMLFGYYDRNGYPNMYTGPTNGGVCPLTNLGQGDDPAHPISGACSIIATANGFDGRSTRGHVDDYWVGYGQSGPDPHVAYGSEHTWGGCTADYMGTNQWKWDTDNSGSVESNTDGSTTFWYSFGSGKLYDYVPPADQGTPQTAACHGMRLFVESRGYTVVQNYNQKVDSQITGGFSLAEYRAEIDAGRPLLVHVTGHTMLGVGYETGTNTIYIHDTWDNVLHSMTWGGTYSGMSHFGVTVIQLGSGGPASWFESSQAVRVTSTGHFYAGAFNFSQGAWSGSNDGWFMGSVPFDISTDQWTGLYVYDYASSSYLHAMYLYRHSY